MSAVPSNKTGQLLSNWTPEDDIFWEQKGKKIAYRVLWISIPNLLLSFAIWMMWSIITVQMKNLGFPFDDQQLFGLAAIAGLAGATLRIPNSFLISISGGRNVVFFSTAAMILPAVGAGLALQDKNTPYVVFAILAFHSGIGGGNFASSMANINRFFPKKIQGAALGLNAGIGNLGVSLMQILIPFVMGFALFGPLSGKPFELMKGDTLTLVYIQNAGLVWIPLLVAASIAAYFGMVNLPGTAFPSAPEAIEKGNRLMIVGGISAGIGAWLLLGMGLNMWVVLPLTIILCLTLLKLVPGKVQESIKTQFTIFSNKHNWIMTVLYLMTFGSFIGFSAAFPLLIKIVFGTMPDGSVNPNAPNPFTYAWLGPLVGSLIRPVGGWLSDKVGGAKITQWNTVVMIGSTLAVAWFVLETREATSPDEFFIPFLICFLVLFITTGIGNGSTFRMIPYIFDAQQAGPVLGWTSAIAAYGAFIIPVVFGQQVKAGTPEYAFIGFTAFYVICLVLNWWYYARKGAEVPC